MSDPAVTVVIPIYNGSRFLGETIASLLAQSHAAFRLVCVDDASTDDSVMIASRFRDPRLTVIVADRHGSLAENWNRSLDAVDTEFAVIAHQDDVYEPEYLVTMLRVIREHPGAFAVHCRTTSIDRNGRRWRLPAGRYKETFWPSVDPYERQPATEIAVLSRGNYVVAPSVMLRMTAVRHIGPFDTNLHFVTDWQYWLRGLRAGFTLAGVHERLVRFRRHPWTATRATELSLRRYEEEIALLRWLGATSFAIVEKTLMSDFAARLAAGDRDAARTLLAFGEREIPGFAGSARVRLLRASLRGGSLAGRLLETGERTLIELAIARHRLAS